MRTYQTKARTGQDGTLQLRVACGLVDTEIDVIVIVEPAGSNGNRGVVEREEWRRFVAETAGSIKDPTFVRRPQGRLENREPLE